MHFNASSFFLFTTYYTDFHGLNSCHLTGFIKKLCEFVDTTVEFKHWYAGHWHENYCYDEKHTIVYDDPSILE